MIELNKIYNEKCEITLDRMDNNFLDLTVTSPPYNVDLGNNKFNKNYYDEYDDNMNYDEYIEWLQSVFTKIYNKTKIGGRCVINIGDGKNGMISTHSDIIQFMKKIGWSVFTTIIWNKSQCGNRCSWGSFNSASNPSFPTPFEYILVFYKQSKKIIEIGESDIEKQEFIDWSLSLWNFVPEINMSDIGHPAMFPIELPKRCIKMLSYKNAVIYDPFAGAGTTALSCVEFDRNFILSEKSKNYCEISKNRINEYSRKFIKDDFLLNL